MPVSIAACIRRHLALPAAARQRPLTRARRSLRVTALLAVLMAPITSSALPRFQQGWLPGLGSVGASGRYSTPSLVDIDGDGDLDVMAGDYYGKFWLTRNVGSATAPRFASATGSDNPLLGIDNGYLSRLLIGDLDGDGDPDVAVGNYCPLRYFDNTGSATAPSFVERTAADSPFSGVACAEYGDFGDLDADGDLDAVLLGPSGSVYLRNTGSSLAAAFVEVTGSASPLPPVGLPITGPLTFGDLDGDGDLDGFVGSGTSLRYLRNTGTATAPGFVEQSGSDNPAAFFAVDGGAYPALGDLDGDHDLDLVIGEHDGSLRYLVNEGTPTAPRFTEPSGKGNPLFGADVGWVSAPATGDLDGDGDLDAVVGRSGGTPATFRNTGSATDPVYVLLTGSADPFAGISISLKSLPTLGDVDGDGDLDAVIGGGQVLAFFRNTGSVSTPAFIEVSGSASPFDGIGQAVLQAAPRLADVDDDGDLDLVLGGYSVTYYAEEMFYWENTGSSSAPAYVQRTESQNPFYFGGGFDTETPALGDLDGDGDLDLVLGVEDDDDEPGYWVTFENVGSASAPVFRAIANPFNGFVTTWGLAPTLADLDGDGDVDMLAGQGQGTLTFFESQRAIFSDGFESGDSSAWMATSP